MRTYLVVGGLLIGGSCLFVGAASGQEPRPPLPSPA